MKKVSAGVRVTRLCCRCIQIYRKVERKVHVADMDGRKKREDEGRGR